MKQSSPKRFIILLVATLVANLASAQVKLGTNPTTINPSSIFEIESANKGFLMPRIALTAANAANPLSAHVAGMIIYNTATAGVAPNEVVPGIYYNDGTRWQILKTQADLDLKESLTNKSTATTLGASNTLYPTQNAVKSYVDNALLAVVTPDATTTAKGKIQLAGDLSGTADAPTVPALLNKENTITAGTNAQYYRGDKTWQTLDKAAVGLNQVDNTADADKQISTAAQTALNLKEELSNKSTAIALGTSNALYPTQNAVKSYVDNALLAVVVPDATTTAKGKIQLAGDLGGSGSTAAAPVISNNAISHAKLAIGAVKNDNIGENIAVANGGTGANMSSTAGYVKQATPGANFTTVSAIPVADVTGAVQKVNGIVPDANGNVATMLGRVFTGTTVDPNQATAVLNANPAKQQSDIYIVADGSNPNNGRTFIYDGANWLEVTTNLSTTDARYVNVAGDTMEGDLTLPIGKKIILTDAPSTATAAANKAYVDAKVASVVASATNGLTATNGSLQLGGSLMSATTITTDAANTLALVGLQDGATSDKMVVVDASGILKSVTATSRNINSIVKKTADYTIADTDYTILANASNNAFTLTLPAASSNNGRVLIIRKTDESANALNFNAAIKISESTSFTTLNINTTIRIQSDGTAWYKID